MDTRMTISGWGAFEEYERGASLAFRDAAMEQVFLFPKLEYFMVHLCQIEATVFRKLCSHIFCNFCIIQRGQMLYLTQKTAQK